MKLLRAGGLRNQSRTIDVMLDDADYEWAQRYHWCVAVRSRHAYAVRYSGRKIFYLHRELMGLVEGDKREVDHINHNSLDCQRSNLRIVTHAQNGQNLPARGRGSTSQYRGVYYVGRNLVKPWVARVGTGNQLRHVGYFRTEEEAAQAAQAFRLQHHPGATC